MAVSIEPVIKKCRSLDIEPGYLGSSKITRREQKKTNHKMSEYGTQLREKQRAKFIYGVLENQFHNYYLRAERMEGRAGENLLVLLERRLDNVVFRLGFARTRREARQIVGHAHISVNGKTVNIPSYQVKPGDVIAVRDKAKSTKRYEQILDATEGGVIPGWLEADRENLKGTVKVMPTRGDVDFPFEENLIVELYSK